MNAHGHNSATHYFDDETSGAFYREGLLCPAVPISQFKKKLHEMSLFPEPVTYVFYMLVDKKKLNCTLAIDSPFQTLPVGLLAEFID